MQELTRNFLNWLVKNGHNYQDELENAFDLFWVNCADLSPIKRNKDTEIFFNEWLMMDFSVPGYDNIPARKKKKY